MCKIFSTFLRNFSIFYGISCLEKCWHIVEFETNLLLYNFLQLVEIYFDKYLAHTEQCLLNTFITSLDLEINNKFQKEKNLKRSLQKSWATL